MLFNVFRISLNGSFWGGFDDLDFLGLFGGFDPLLAGLVDRISVFKLWTGGAIWRSILTLSRGRGGTIVEASKLLLLRSEISFAACQKIRKYRKGSLDYTLELILLDPSEVNVKIYISKNFYGTDGWKISEFSSRSSQRCSSRSHVIVRYRTNWGFWQIKFINFHRLISCYSSIWQITFGFIQKLTGRIVKFVHFCKSTVELGSNVAQNSTKNRLRKRRPTKCADKSSQLKLKPHFLFNLNKIKFQPWKSIFKHQDFKWLFSTEYLQLYLRICKMCVVGYFLN